MRTYILTYVYIYIYICNMMLLYHVKCEYERGCGALLCGPRP